MEDELSERERAGIEGLAPEYQEDEEARYRGMTLQEFRRHQRGQKSTPEEIANTAAASRGFGILPTAEEISRQDKPRTLGRKMSPKEKAATYATGTLASLLFWGNLGWGSDAETLVRAGVGGGLVAAALYMMADGARGMYKEFKEHRK